MNELPVGWADVKLEEIALVIMGQSPESRFYNVSGNGLPFFQGKAEFGDLYPTVRKWCTEPTKIASAGDILMSVRAPVGPTNIALERCCIGRGLTAIQAVPPVVQKYLLYSIRAKESWLAQQGTGTTFAAVSGDFVRALEILVAPFAEQKRIANKLDILLARVDACRERLDRLPGMIKAFRQAVLAAACSGRLTEEWRVRADVSDTRVSNQDQPSSLASVPTSWQWVSLKSITEIKGGITVGQKRRPEQIVRSIPYLRVANVQRGQLNLTEIRSIEATESEIAAMRLKAGDILLNEGGDRDKLGRGWIWEDQITECIHQNHVFRARLTDSSTQPKYISWYCNAIGADYFTDAGKQTTNLASISMTKLGALQVPLPPAVEQAEIVRRVEILFALADRIESRLGVARAAVERATPALLAKAFRGELVPQDPNDEPASELLERIRAARVAEDSVKSGKRTK